MAGFEWTRMAVFALGTASLVAPAAAQDARDLDGASSDIRVFSGSIEEEPARFLLTVPAGNALVIDAIPAASSMLDPYLRVTDAESGEVLAEDDDSAGSLGARAFLTTEAERRISIEVSSERAVDTEQERGNFELSVRQTDWSPTPPQQVAFGSKTRGELHGGESHVFHVEAVPGQILTAVLRSDADSGLDPYLELRRGTASTGEVLVEDDDSAGSLNARLRYVIRDGGTYTLVARGVGNSSAGTYTLEIGDGSQRAAAPAEQELSFGDPLAGELGATIGTDGEDVRQIIYRFSDEAKAALQADPGLVTFRMRKLTEESELDPMLELAFETPLGLAIVASDDDSGGNLDAELAINLAPLVEQPEQLDNLRLIGRSLADADGEFTLEAVKE